MAESDGGENRMLGHDKSLIVMLFLVMAAVAISADVYAMKSTLSFSIDAAKQLLTAFFVVTVQRWAGNRASDPTKRSTVESTVSTTEVTKVSTPPAPVIPEISAPIIAETVKVAGENVTVETPRKDE